jgi:magnesium transporter
VPFLSEIVDRPVFDRDGEQTGKVRDLLIAPDSPYPPVRSLVVTSGRRRSLVPWAEVAAVTPRGVGLKHPGLGGARPVVSPAGDTELVWLRRDVMDRQIIDTNGIKLVRVNDVLMASIDGELRTAGVDASFAGILRRLGLTHVGRRNRNRGFIDWQSVDLTPAVQELRLRVPYGGLQRLHPADIATVIEQMTPRAAADALEAMRDETAAATMAELEGERQAAVLAAMEPAEAAGLLNDMDADEAADALGGMTEDDALELLGLMQPRRARAVRLLLNYEEDTAGGVMTTNFLTVAPHAQVGEVTERLRLHPALTEDIAAIYVVDDDRRLLGAVPALQLLAASPELRVEEVMARDAHAVPALAEREEVARTLIHYGLPAAPVVDDEGRVVGVVTLVDLAELLAPKGWRAAPRRMSA